MDQSLLEKIFLLDLLESCLCGSSPVRNLCFSSSILSPQDDKIKLEKEQVGLQKSASDLRQKLPYNVEEII